MTSLPSTRLASAIVIVTGMLWGLYWMPVRALADLGLAGATGTLAITGAAAVALAPFALRHAGALRRADGLALCSIALGGGAFALYSIGFVYGRVAIIILLYFLTPVWSTLIGKYVMGWRTTRLRLLAIAVGLIGLTVMLAADGQAPLPRGVGEWMALVAGVLWSVATTGMRVRAPLAPVPAAFVFACGATAISAALLPFLPDASVASVSPSLSTTVLVAVPTGVLWWGVMMVSLMWATVRLEPARVGILLMSEVIVGAASAALFAAEHLAPLEILGGALVLCAGVLEIWPGKPGPAPATAAETRKPSR